MRHPTKPAKINTNYESNKRKLGNINVQERIEKMRITKLIKIALLLLVATSYSQHSAARFLQTDPIGYKDDMDLYTYVGNDPVNHTDPTGLEVDQVFDQNKGTLTTTDLDTHKSVVSEARSGGDFNSPRSILSGQGIVGAPIGGGKYDILKGPNPTDKGNYRLEQKGDKQYGDDKTKDGRSSLREHTGTKTAGCVLITSNGQATLNAVNETKTSQAQVLNDNSDPSKGTHTVEKYGTLTVIPLEDPNKKKP